VDQDWLALRIINRDGLMPDTDYFLDRTCQMYVLELCELIEVFSFREAQAGNPIKA
jgi:hypothetical protein